jgi:hypothetical protein
MRRVHRNAINRTDLHALGLIKMPHTLGAFVGVDFIDLHPHVDRLVRALGFADIAIDAFVGDHQSHVVTFTPARAVA